MSQRVTLQLRQKYSHVFITPLDTFLPFIIDYNFTSRLLASPYKVKIEADL